MASSLKGFEKLAWYYQGLVVAGFCGLLLGLFWYQYLSPMKVTIVEKQAEVLMKVIGFSEAEVEAMFEAESTLSTVGGAK